MSASRVQPMQSPVFEPGPTGILQYSSSVSAVAATKPFDSVETRPAVECNLPALCEHIQAEGFDAGSFSDVSVQAMGSTYRLHRLILSRSSYFRNMLHGPWKESSALTVILNIDDDNVNLEAIELSLAYLYGRPPKLNNKNAFRVLAAASFLDLQDLCVICTDFIISELWTSNFLQYQVFAERQDYGMHGERIKIACWGYLCQCATSELRHVLPKLSSRTLHSLLMSNELWVPNEEKRFELALHTLLVKGAISGGEFPSRGTGNTKIYASNVDYVPREGESFFCRDGNKELLEPELHQLNIVDELGPQNNLSHMGDFMVDIQKTVPTTILMQNDVDSTKKSKMDAPMDEPSSESRAFQLNDNIWLPGDQSRGSLSGSLPVDESFPIAPEKGDMLFCGGRVVGKRQIKISQGCSCLSADDYNTFVNIFERGSLLYCSMSFESLLNVRRQLEELGFPCKAVNDGLWLQMLLCHKVQAIVSDTCRSCCLTNSACACVHIYSHSAGSSTSGYCREEHDRGSSSGNTGNMYLSEGQSDGNGLFSPVRVHMRGTVDGLAGIGRGSSNVTGAGWPPRYVFSRVPHGFGNRNGQQLPANNDSEHRVDRNSEMSAGGLTALVGLTNGSNASRIQSEQTEKFFEANLPFRWSASSTGSSSTVQMTEPDEHWERSDDFSMSLDLNTPLSHFPPFRFGVEFEDVHRLSDGQVKHSSEVFYAGSLWKVSVQAFSDEDPQGRRTLGLFLHRRKAEISDPLRKVQMYIDSREKVLARYQLICPSKREVMVFGSLKQAGTLLPKAPKGWGWRTALLFDELADLLQGGALRVTAIVQLV